MRLSGQLLSAVLLLAAASAHAQPVSPDVPAPVEQPVDPTAAPDAAEAEAEPGTAAGSTPAAAASEEEAALQSARIESAPEPTPVGADTVEPEPEALEELSAAELATLGLDMDSQGLDTDLHFSGFMDVTYLQLLNPEESVLTVPAYGDSGSFFVGRFNLYATKNLTQTFSMMAEVRFTYAPNGTGTVQPGTTPVSTDSLDYSGSALTFRWGGVVIERAYGQWSPFPFLNLRVGQFLTPYGIWNVDHGSPVFIPVTRPFAVGGSYFPERQTGLDLFGRVGLTSALAAEYHLTLSNGLGPASEYRDLDDNKAIGGRLALEHLAGGSRFQLGGSVFYGESSESYPQIGVNDDGTALTLVKGTSGQAEVLSAAADLLWQYRGFHLQIEWVGQRWEYANQGRTVLPTAGQLGIPPNATPADAFSSGGYALIGYRLPWWGLMPFATVEYANTNNFGILTKTYFSQTGINLRPADAIVLKLEYHFGFKGSPGTVGKTVAAQLAWAF